MLENFIINRFQKLLSDLPDVPQLSAQELKRYFDASPEELKNALNGVIDTLMSTGGAKDIGFEESDKVHAGNVQDAILNVQGQIKDVALGQIPEGSVGEKQLAGGILEKWTVEASERKAADTALSNRINAANSTLTSTKNTLQKSITEVKATADNALSLVSLKAEFLLGQYAGTGTSYNTIELGFKPRVVFVTSGEYYAHAIGDMTSPGIGLLATGFQMYQYADDMRIKIRMSFNDPRRIYYYIVMK